MSKLLPVISCITEIKPETHYFITLLYVEGKSIKYEIKVLEHILSCSLFVIVADLKKTSIFILFVLLCVLCFQRQPFRFVIIMR